MNLRTLKHTREKKVKNEQEVLENILSHCPSSLLHHHPTRNVKIHLYTIKSTKNEKKKMQKCALGETRSRERRNLQKLSSFFFLSLTKSVLIHHMQIVYILPDLLAFVVLPLFSLFREIFPLPFSRRLDSP